MNLNDLIYSFKIENNNDKLSSNVIFELNNIRFSVNAKELLEQLKEVYEKFKQKTEIKLIIAKDFVLEIKRQQPVEYHENEDLWYIYLNSELIDNNPLYSTQYLNMSQVSHILSELITQIEVLFNLVENNIFYKYAQNHFDSVLAFKLIDSNEYINYDIKPLEDWGENKDLVLIMEMLNNYLTNQSNSYDCILEGEPTLAVYDHHLFIQNNKLFLGYKPSEYFTEEQIADWNEHTNHEFEQISQCSGTIKEIARELFEQINQYQEDIIKNWRETEKQQFKQNLESLKSNIY